MMTRDRYVPCSLLDMSPDSKKPNAPAKAHPSTPALERARENGDFADEAGPKSSEFETREDAEDITQGDFDTIP